MPKTTQGQGEKMTLDEINRRLARLRDIEHRGGRLLPAEARIKEILLVLRKAKERAAHV